MAGTPSCAALPTPPAFFEDFRARPLCDVAGDGQCSKRSRTLGVHDTLWNAFAVEVLHLLEQCHVLHQFRTTRSCGESVLNTDWRAVGGGQNGDFAAESFDMFVGGCISRV